MMKHPYLILATLFFGVSVPAQKLPFKTVPQQRLEGEYIKKLRFTSSIDSFVKLQKRTAAIQPIAMPNVKPKDRSIYLALKGKSKNIEQYPILNTVPTIERLKK